MTSGDMTTLLQAITSAVVLVTAALTAYNTARAATAAVRVQNVAEKLDEVHTLVNSTNTRLEATALVDRAMIQSQSIALAAANERLIAQGPPKAVQPEEPKP